MTVTSLPPAGWQRYAACRRADPDLFFPVSAGDPAAGRAKQVCEGCAVREDCLSFAISTGQEGVWGGTTEDERRTAAHEELMRAQDAAGRNSGEYRRAMAARTRAIGNASEQERRAGWDAIEASLRRRDNS